MDANTLICPLCQDVVDKRLFRFHLGSERQVIERISKSNPAWSENDGVCSRCIDYYHTEVIMRQRVLPEIGPHFPVKSADDFIILPTGLRLDADPRFTGKGVTICFIDSGFYPHPDLVKYRNRISAMIDITKPLTNSATAENPESAWHGTMTSVVCTGDGSLSNGLYKGIASDAMLVLLKVQDQNGNITTDNIVKALQWVENNHEQFKIRIVNMSLGDKEAVSYEQSEVDRFAEKLIAKGIVVVAAVGNDENGSIKPPANAPNVIAVGGIDDENKLEEVKKLYHSSYGKTIDEFMKPELTAPAIWIAAPILPETSEQKESELLHRLLTLPDEELPAALADNLAYTDLKHTVSPQDNVSFIRERILRRLQTCKFITANYMHVDGTSFAAPIVSSVIAQLLEADPQLSPAVIREVIFSTSKRISGVAAERQGFGIIQPRKAILKILKREIIAKPHASPYIDRQQNVIEFYMRNDCATHISLAGCFNQWAQDILQLEPGRNGIWKIRIPMLPEGRYRYKFFIDEKDWAEDIDNPFREPDGFNGFNSILDIKN